MGILDFENAFSFATFTTPQGTPVYASRDENRDECYNAKGADEFCSIPEDLLIGD